MGQCITIDYLSLFRFRLSRRPLVLLQPRVLQYTPTLGRRGPLQHMHVYTTRHALHEQAVQKHWIW